MRRAGRRIPWKTLIDELGLVGTIRTHSSTYGDQEPYNVAVLNASDSPIAKEMELFEPELVMLGDQALILRGSDAVVPEDWQRSHIVRIASKYFTVGMAPHR